MVADGQGGFLLTPAETLFPVPVSASLGLPSHFPGALMEGFHLREEGKKARVKKTGAGSKVVEGDRVFALVGLAGELEAGQRVYRDLHMHPCNQ